eukprot:4756342-Amphidinium_carterae.1
MVSGGGTTNTRELTAFLCYLPCGLKTKAALVTKTRCPYSDSAAFAHFIGKKITLDDTSRWARSMQDAIGAGNSLRD